MHLRYLIFESSEDGNGTGSWDSIPKILKVMAANGSPQPVLKRMKNA